MIKIKKGSGKGNAKDLMESDISRLGVESDISRLGV